MKRLLHWKKSVKMAWDSFQSNISSSNFLTHGRQGLLFWLCWITNCLPMCLSFAGASWMFFRIVGWKPSQPKYYTLQRLPKSHRHIKLKLEVCSLHFIHLQIRNARCCFMEINSQSLPAPSLECDFQVWAFDQDGTLPPPLDLSCIWYLMKSVCTSCHQHLTILNNISQRYAVPFGVHRMHHSFHKLRSFEKFECPVSMSYHSIKLFHKIIATKGFSTLRRWASWSGSRAPPQACVVPAFASNTFFNILTRFPTMLVRMSYIYNIHSIWCFLFFYSYFYYHYHIMYFLINSFFYVFCDVFVPAAYLEAPTDTWPAPGRWILPHQRDPPAGLLANVHKHKNWNRKMTKKAFPNFLPFLFWRYLYTHGKWGIPLLASNATSFLLEDGDKTNMKHSVLDLFLPIPMNKPILRNSQVQPGNATAQETELWLCSKSPIILYNHHVAWNLSSPAKPAPQ